MKAAPPETIVGGQQKMLSALHTDFYIMPLSIYSSDATVYTSFRQ